MMNISSNCFTDKEIIGFIESFGIKGKCDICLEEDVYIAPLAELEDFFQELLDNFKLSNSTTSLTTKIQGDWSLFTNNKIATEVINLVIPDLNTEIPNATQKVDYADEIQENVAYWGVLKEELKWEKRFFTDFIFLTEDLGWDGFFNTQYLLDDETTLFRARVHHNSGQDALQPAKMKSPPKYLTTGGRANPSGIPYLYLSDNPVTVLHEVRASYLDELTIGQFQLANSNSIKIVDFTEDTSIFQPKKVTETIKAKLFREAISHDLSKPMRRYDSEIEYIPTQFICEFIKVTTGAAGIRFTSSLHPSGKNIVIFDDGLLNCISTEVVKVTSISLKYQIISRSENHS